MLWWAFNHHNAVISGKPCRQIIAWVPGHPFEPALTDILEAVDPQFILVHAVCKPVSDSEDNIYYYSISRTVTKPHTQ